MLRKDLKILIVEDDASAGKALSEGLRRSGYAAVQAVKSPKEALQALKLNSYHLMLIDCLLPEISGLDLAKQIRSEGQQETRIIFSSGVFKDQKFIKKALEEAKATHFLTKPFAIDDLIAAVDLALSDLLEEVRDPHLLLLQKEDVGPEHLLSALKASDVIHAFQLPYHISVLIEAKWSGRIELTPTDLDPATLFMKQGKIIDFRMTDAQSFFGVLLIEMGYALSEDVQHLLRGQKDKRLGELLVEDHAVSPHAVKLARLEQIVVRLSKIISNRTLQLELQTHDEFLDDPGLTTQQYMTALQDWISSKISENWLRQYYYSWMDYPIKLTQKIEKISHFRDSYFLQANPRFLSQIAQEKPLSKLLDDVEAEELLTLQTIHFGLLSRNLFFGEKVKSAKDYVLEFNRLKKLTERMHEKNHFELLGLPQSVTQSTLHKTYTETARNFHPDRIDPQAPQEFKTLANEYFTQVTAAYEAMKDDTKREAYKKTLEIGQLKEILNVESQLEDCNQLIRKGQYKSALIKLQKLELQPHHPSKIKLLIAWARLKNLPEDPQSVGEILNKFQKLMHTIPPEDRHSVEFFFVKGLYYRLIGQHSKAASYLRNCLTLDPTFSEAKSELIRAESKTRTQSRKSIDQIPTMITRFIKKSS